MKLFESIRDIKNKYPLSEKYNAKIDGLIDLYANGEIILQPKYQRNLVWDAGRKNRLIESILLGFPLGNIVLVDNRETDIYEVIDGLQRLSTILDYTNLLKEADTKIKGYTPFKKIERKYFYNQELANLIDGFTWSDFLKKDPRAKFRFFSRASILREDIYPFHEDRNPLTDDQIQMYFNNINAGVPQTETKD